jgi:hypothetical protein
LLLYYEGRADKTMLYEVPKSFVGMIHPHREDWLVSLGCAASISADVVVIADDEVVVSVQKEMVCKCDNENCPVRIKRGKNDPLDRVRRVPTGDNEQHAHN